VTEEIQRSSRPALGHGPLLAGDGRSVSKESIAALEDAAKQLISITSLTQGIYFAAISFSDLKKPLSFTIGKDGYWCFYSPAPSSCGLSA